MCFYIRCDYTEDVEHVQACLYNGFTLRRHVSAQVFKEVHLLYANMSVLKEPVSQDRGKRRRIREGKINSVVQFVYQVIRSIDSEQKKEWGDQRRGE